MEIQMEWPFISFISHATASAGWRKVAPSSRLNCHTILPRGSTDYSYMVVGVLVPASRHTFPLCSLSTTRQQFLIADDWPDGHRSPTLLFSICAFHFLHHQRNYTIWHYFYHHPSICIKNSNRCIWMAKKGNEQWNFWQWWRTGDWCRIIIHADKFMYEMGFEDTMDQMLANACTQLYI